jgi:hypothetical protein
MWGRKPESAEPARLEPPHRLKEALRRARIDSAERTGVVVDLHDAEIARLELLNDALDPIFAEVPSDVDLFDRGVSRGETPRLWIDAIAHIAMGRDTRVHRFVQDTRHGRKVLAETADIAQMTDAVTKYLARRMIERERALAGTDTSDSWHESAYQRQRRLRHAAIAFVLGALAGLAVLVAAALLTGPR